MRDRILAEEQSLLDAVSTLLAEVPVVAPPSEAGTVKELMRLRDEVQAAKDEDKAAILMQFEHTYALLEQLRAARDAPEVDPASPYFAHLRLSENGKERDLCLGKATRIERGIRIVDWRNAPISRIFYSYEQGEEFEELFGERIMLGKVAARRTITIHNGELERIDAPEGTLLREGGAWALETRPAPRLAGGQGAASTKFHAAGEGGSRRMGTDSRGRTIRADKRLPDIAGLIDPEQFDLITRPDTGFLVIRGTAGSGKTTVALHRIAYLAYLDEQVNSTRTLFLVFSKALRDYVGRVLPALGVGRVKPMTFPEWARLQLRKHFPMLPKHRRDDTPEVVMRMKLHPVTMITLEEHVESVEAAGNVEQAVDDWASVITQLDVIKPRFDRLAPGAFTAGELARATTWCRDRHEEMLSWMDGEDGGVGELDPEDEPLLLRAFQLRVGPLRHQGKRKLRYRHIAIDEVQDFSPIEVRVLIDCLDHHESITLAGDTQQHVMSNAGFTSWAEFFDYLGVGGHSVDTLRVAYRSSRQVVEFALALLGELREDDTPPMVVREGPPVELFQFTEAGAAVGFLADTLKRLSRDEPLASVALVTPNAETSAIYHDGLRRSEVPRLRRVVDEEFSFMPGVEIVEARWVKGLEFDYVIIVDATARAYPDTDGARRMLHVAATRAIHQLWITSVGTVSPIIREAVALASAAQADSDAES